MADRRTRGTAPARKGGASGARKKAPATKPTSREARSGASNARGAKKKTTAVRKQAAASAKAAVGKRVAASPRTSEGTSRRGSSSSTTKRASGSVAAKRSQGTAVPTRPVRIRELDPRAMCGPGTSVVQLFRVDDLPVGTDTTHLVYFDRHGWYCQHGRECPAVRAVRRRQL